MSYIFKKYHMFFRSIQNIIIFYNLLYIFPIFMRIFLDHLYNAHFLGVPQLMHDCSIDKFIIQ